MNLSIDEILDSTQGNKSWCPPNAQFRYLPKSILHASKIDFIINGDPSRVLEYICNAFYIYRETVNTKMFAPHVLMDDAYEWPSSIYFEWSNVDDVTSLGSKIHQHSNSRNDIRVESPTNNEMHKSFKYDIKDINKVSVLFSDMWQNASLQKYVAPLASTLMYLKNGKIPPDAVGNGLIEYLEALDNDRMPEY